MPILPCQEIATQFKERWMKLHPEDKDNVNGSVHLDDSLTSLQWLHNYSILGASLESHPGSTCYPSHLLNRHQQPQNTDSPYSPTAGDTAASGMPQGVCNPITSSASNNRNGSSFFPQQKGTNHTGVPASVWEEMNYKTNHRVKPPHSYATLICMAMQANKKNKITLSTIYNWITENFCYYRHAEPSWQNSIRHNLSLNKCFMKVPRQKNEPGKGGFWQIDPQHADMFVNGVFKRRRTPASHFNTQRRRKPLVTSGPPHTLDPQEWQRCPLAYYGMSRKGHKHKQPAVKRGAKWPAVAESPGLVADARDMEALRGELDWARVFDDVLNGSSSNFDDLELNLSSVGCEMELSQQRHVAGMGKWCSTSAEQACRDMETSENMGCSLEEIQHHTHGLQLALPAGHARHYEELTLFSDQQRHPWEELKEEVQAVPVTLDHSFGFSEGFCPELQPWERAEMYM